MDVAALSSREFREVVNHITRMPTRWFRAGPFWSRAYRPVSHARGWVVRMRESGVSRESTRLTVEGIRNNTC